MSALETDVRAALQGVEDPDLHRSIVDLGMVQGVAIDGGRVVVAVASPLPGDACRTRVGITHAGRIENGFRSDRIEKRLRYLATKIRPKTNSASSCEILCGGRTGQADHRFFPSLSETDE